MRLKPGPLTTVANESITSRLLIEAGVLKPDFMTSVISAFPEITPFLSLLDVKGYKTKGVSLQSNALTDGGSYIGVSSNHIQYLIRNSDIRREHFSTNSDGITFYDAVYAAATPYPGQHKRTFYIYLDSNWFGSGDVGLMADGRTQLYFVSDAEPTSGGGYEYMVKVDGKDYDEYADPELMMEGDEIVLATTKFTHDFSVGGNERHTFGGFGHCWLTLQRFKYSWSGTAKVMDAKQPVQGRWVYSGGNTKDSMFLKSAEELMLKDIAKRVEFQLLEGKGTVSDINQKVQLTNSKNQEIVSGDGVLYSGDGAIEFPLNDGWTKKSIDAFLTDVNTYVRADEQGNRELAMHMHPKGYMSFQRALRDMGVTIDSNIVGEGGEKIVNNTYAGYELGGLKLLAHQSRYVEGRPGKTLKDGTRSNEWDAICVPLGLTEGGSRGVQTVQLRGLTRGRVSGIDAGGNIATEIDGSSEHALIQVGVISQIQPIIVGRPWKGNIA